MNPTGTSVQLFGDLEYFGLAIVYAFEFFGLCILAFLLVSSLGMGRYIQKALNDDANDSIEKKAIWGVAIMFYSVMSYYAITAVLNAGYWQSALISVLMIAFTILFARPLSAMVWMKWLEFVERIKESGQEDSKEA